MVTGPSEIFLKLDGIPGESTDSKHKNEIDVVSYDENVKQSGVPLGSAGASAGRATFADVRFRKAIDKSSPKILLACAGGQHIKDARFTFRRPGPISVEFYKVKLTDVLVVAITQVAGTGSQYPLSFGALDTGSDQTGFLDEVALAFSKIEWEYQPIGKDGKPAGPPIKAGWDVKANHAI
jgi:type VI secretion system secreted protein Hcp